MNLKNDFLEKDRDLFAWVSSCWSCGLDHCNILHHILGRVSNSPLNAAPLNNFKCHIGCNINDYKTKKKFLQKTYFFLKAEGYTLKEKDKEFIKDNKKYYDNIILDKVLD